MEFEIAKTEETVVRPDKYPPLKNKKRGKRY